MFKLESYITPLLMGYLDKYVKLRQEDFQLSLWGGDAVLSNLDLRLDELEKVIQLPVVFQSGHIHELRLHVPWTKLGSEPVIVTINTVECIMKVRDRAYEGSSASQSSEAAAKVAQQKLKVKRKQQDEENLPPGYLQSIVNRIINNVSFVFNNLILKFVEDDIVLSVNIKSAECYSVDRDWNRAFVDLLPDDLALRKVINFADLTVCLDKTNASGHIESYQEPMVYRCAVTCRLHMSYDSVTAKFPKATRFNVYCDTLNLCLTDTQLPMFVRLLELLIAMYYGYLDIPSVADNAPDSTTSMDAQTAKPSEATSLNVSSPYGLEDNGGGEGWASWAWSMVPQILPPGEEEEDEGGGGATTRRGRTSPLVLSIGFYVHQGNIIFKLTERSKDGSELPHKKIHFHPFLTMAYEGASLEVLLQGLEFCDVQSGITSCHIYAEGNCICGVSDEDVTRCHTLLRAGEALSQKMQITYLSNSLFDATSFENQGHTAPHILNRDLHLQTYTEQFGLTKFGAFWNDYLYTFDKPDKHRTGAGSNSSDTDQAEAIFDREFSNLRFLLGDVRVTVSSTFHHRLAKFTSCMWDPQYEAYGAGKNLSDGSEDRPKPREDQIHSLESFIPTQLVHLALINPSMTLLPSEHPKCDADKKTYRSRHKKKDSKKDESQQSKDLAAIVIAASRFDLQVTKPMYPGRLVKLVSAIAGPSSNLLHHCHRHTQIKLFGLQAGLQRTSANGSVSRPLTLVPPFSFAVYFRYLVLPKLWTNSSLSLSEWMFEVPNVSINMNKASVIMLSQITSSWAAPKSRHKADCTADSLLDDLFPVSGESTCQTFPLLELNLCSLEFKACSSTLVDAFTASVSSIQLVLYTPGVGGKLSVVPILCGPSNTSQITKSDFFNKKEVVSLDPVTSDCVTVTLQKPKNITVREAPALALVDCQGMAVWLDPGLMGWFHYCPQPRPTDRGTDSQQQQTQQAPVSLDLTLAHITSPLNAVSQASVHSTSSQSRTGASRPLTPSVTPRGHRDSRTVHSAPSQLKKEKGDTQDDSQRTTLGDTFAAYFPLIRALHLQVDMNSSVLFLPKAGMPTTSESCQDLVTTIQQAFVKGRLSPTLVLCLPAISVTSVMAKRIHVLQELPTTTTDASTGSLIGDRLPWTIKLSGACVYSLVPGVQIVGPSFLLHPVDVVSTLAVNSTYSPPTSEHISSLALCIHVDVGTVKTDFTTHQLHLLSVTSCQVSSLVSDVTSLSAICLKMFASVPSGASPTTSPRDNPSVRKSVSSSTHRIRTCSHSLQSGEVTDQGVTDASEDLSQDASPLHENIVNNEDEVGTKLSLWLQLMLPKVDFTVYHTSPQSQKESGVSLTLENLDLCLDSQSVYSKVKVNLSSFHVQHSCRGLDGSWNWSELDGVVVTCTHQLPRNLRIISNKLWVSDNPSTLMSFGNHQSHDAMGRDKKHGVMSVTMTRALCKNVKKRLKKANVELPSVSEAGYSTEDVGGVSADYGNIASTSPMQFDSGFFYFHEYLSEVCLKTGPIDVIMKPEAIDVLTSFFSSVVHKGNPRLPKSDLNFPKDTVMFEDFDNNRVPHKPLSQQQQHLSSLSSSSPSSSSNTESFSVQNLPLIYADVGMMRFFLPLPSGHHHPPHHQGSQILCDKPPASISSFSPLASQLPHSSISLQGEGSQKRSQHSTQPSTKAKLPSDNQTHNQKTDQPSTTRSSTTKSDNKSFSNQINSSFTQHSRVSFSQGVPSSSQVASTNSSTSSCGHNDDNVGAKVSSTLDHTMVVIQLSSLNIAPHADNPLTRNALETAVYQHALQSGHAHQPGSSVEDRQYQVEVKGLAVSTGCWDRVMQEARHSVTQHSSSGSRVQIPALEWNTFLMDGLGHERKEILLAPLASSFDVTLVVAPPINCTPKQLDHSDRRPTHLICGMTTELNITSDLDLYLSNGQFKLLSLLASQFTGTNSDWSQSPTSPSLTKHQPRPVNNTCSDCVDKGTMAGADGIGEKMAGYNKGNDPLDPHHNHQQRHHYRYHHHHQNYALPGGDSGVESDVSTATIGELQGNRVGGSSSYHHHKNQQHHHPPHQASKKFTRTTTGSERKKETMIHEAVSRMTDTMDLQNDPGIRGVAADGMSDGDKDEEKMVLDLLMTAGRISVTVYTHKVLEETVIQELPSFHERRSNQRMRHQSSHAPATPTGTTTTTNNSATRTSPAVMTPCRDNLEEKLKSVPLKRYGSSSSYQSEAASEDEENSDANEDSFTEFNFMKQTSVESNQSLKKTLETGSVCVLPFVYVYMTQPHCLVSTGNHSKFEAACYDLLVKGASDSHLSPVEEYHMIPDCADFNVHWLETRAGLPHPYTGIPPSLLTVRRVKDIDRPDTASIHIERPLRLKVSQLAIEQSVTFAMELSAVSNCESRCDTHDNRTTNTRADFVNVQGMRGLDEGDDDNMGGFGVLLSSVERLELSTSQLVVVMEMGQRGDNDADDSSPAVGAVASLEGLSVALDVSKTGNDKCPSIEGHAEVKDALVKLSYEKKSSPLIGPLSFNVEATLTWISTSTNQELLQLAVVLETGLVMIKLGQEHVFCLTQLSSTLAGLYQSILDKTGVSPTTAASTTTSDQGRPLSKPSKTQKGESPHPFMQDHSYDDLRRGGFDYLEEPEGVCLEPEVNQIIFSSHNISGNRDTTTSSSNEDGGDGYMLWRYPQPRVITNVQLTPVPFGLASSPTTTNTSSNATSTGDSISGGQTKVQCLLQYYDDSLKDFQTCAQFQLLESEPVTVSMPQPKPHNASQLVVSTTWKVVLLQSTAEGFPIGKNSPETRRRDAAVLPVSLAACMCVDSVFIPSLIPTLKTRVYIPMVDVRLCHHLDYNGSEVPSKLNRFHPRTELVSEQEYAVIRLDEVGVSVSHSGGAEARSSFKLSMTNWIDVMDYTCLALKKVVAPVRVSADANLIACRGQSKELEVKIDMDQVCVRVGKNIVHTVNMALSAWNTFSPACDGPLVIFYHFVICNDTSSVIRFGQSGTDENISLGSREMYAYSWRSFNMAQLLHLCLDQPSWRWTDPFPITQPGVWVRQVKVKDQDYAVIVKVTKLSAVQLQVTITGQLLLSNQLSLPIAVRFGVGDNDTTSNGGPRHQYTLQPGSCLPSMTSSHIMAHPIQLRLAGFSAPWSHEISLSGDGMKDTQMVKIHLPGDSGSYFHIWCRIFCQHFQGNSQKLVMLSPLYVVRTHLPQPLFICLDSPKVKESQELLVKSQGRDFQLHLQGGDVTHSMAFRLGPGMPMSSPPVILSTGLIGQLDRSGRRSGEHSNGDNVPDIEQLCNLRLDTGHMTWPYLEMGEMEKGDVGGVDGLNQPETHLQKSSFPSDLDPVHDPFELTGPAHEHQQQQPSIDLSVHLCEYVPGCETLLVNVSPSCLVTNTTDLCVVVAEVVTQGGGEEMEEEDKGRGKEGQVDGGMGKMERETEDVGRRWILNPGQTLSPPLPKDLLSIAVMDGGRMTSARHIPLSDKPMDHKRYNEDIGKVLFVDGFVQAALVFEGTATATTEEVVFLTVTSDIHKGIQTICIRDSFGISNLHSTGLTTKLLAVPKKCPRGSTSMADAKAVTLILEAKGQGGNEVTPIPRWSVLKTEDQTLLRNVTLPQDSLVFYVAFGLMQAVDTSTPTPIQWSLPIRIPTHTKESVRSTTSLPHTYHHPKDDDSDTTDTAAIMTSQALCVTTHYSRGVFRLVAMADTAPVLLVENLCPFGLQFGQSCDQLRADEVTIQEQLELVGDLPCVSAGGWCHYTPPTINSQFGSTETVTIPRINFREASGPSQWSSPVQASATDAFVRLRDVCDLKIMIEVVGMVHHLVIRPVSKAEITAKEIRTRLKDGEIRKQEAKDAVKADQMDSKPEGESSGKTTPFSMDVFEKFSERDAVREKYLEKNPLNITIGVLSRSVTFFLQDETYPSDVNDILALHLTDLFLASFPISKNPSVIISKNCLAVSVGNAQLDNQLCGSGAYDFPVVFIRQNYSNSNSDEDLLGKSKTSSSQRKDSGLNNKAAGLLSKTSVIESVALLRSKAMLHAQVVTLSDAIWGQSVIDVIDLSIQPCSLYIDDGFVYRIMEELELFFPSRLSVPAKQPWGSSGSPKNCQRLPSKVLASAFELSQPLRIRSLTIHQVQLLLSVHASLKLFLASDHTPLNLGQFERQAVYTRPQRLIHSVTMHYASAAIFRAGIVVGSLEILGNPTGLVRSISAGVSDLISLPYWGLARGPGAFVGGVTKGLGSLVRNVSAGMITSMTNFASSMSRNMDRLSLDQSHQERQEVNRRNRPNGISQGVLQGLTGFGLSLLGAVAGLADQPLRTLVQSEGSSDQRAMTATSTASGIVTGMGKGLVGVLTKPIGGAAELVSQTGQGILQGTGLGQMPTRILPPPSSSPLSPSSSSSSSSLSQHASVQSPSEAPVIWSSGFKYAVKVLTTLPSPILFSFPAVTFDLVGDEVDVVLVLTSDLLVVVNVEEDAQQQTLSLSELHCRCHGDDDDDDHVDTESAGEASNETAEVDGVERRRRERRHCERMGGFTLVWTDHFYSSSRLEQQHNTSKERVAAFIDSTQKLTTWGPNHDLANTPLPLAPALPLTTKESPRVGDQRPTIEDQLEAFPLSDHPHHPHHPQDQAPSSHQSGQPRSLSDDTNRSERNNFAAPTTTRGQGHASTSSAKSSTTADVAPPEYRFKMNSHQMRIFVHVFETAKNRLQGRGFPV